MDILQKTMGANKIWRSVLLVSCIALSACSTGVSPGHKGTHTQVSSLEFVEESLSKNFTVGRLKGTTENQPVMSSTSLTLAGSVQLLLSQSPTVRSAISGLGIADAQQLQAEVINNPRISLGAMKPEHGGRWQLDAGLSQPLLELFTRPLRRELAQENVLRAQLQLQSQLQELIVQTHRYYYSAVAAQQHLHVQQQVLEAAKAQQQLALSLYRAGNMAENNFLYYDNELRRVQQQLNKRQQIANEKRLHLFNLIGLVSFSTQTIPSQLPLPTADVLSYAELIAIAKDHRLELQIAHQQVQLLDKRRRVLAAENGWRDNSIGINAEREFDGTTNVGPELEFALPIFNRGQGKLAMVDAQLSQVKAELQQHELAMDLAIAQALNNVQAAQQQLLLLGQSLQVAEKRVTLANREVNFMLTSPFQLLEIKRDEIQLAHDYTDELNNYWQARSQLELAIGKELSAPTDKMDHLHMEHSSTDHANDHSLHHFQPTDEVKKSGEHKEHHHD